MINRTFIDCDGCKARRVARPSHWFVIMGARVRMVVCSVCNGESVQTEEQAGLQKLEPQGEA